MEIFATLKTWLVERASVKGGNSRMKKPERFEETVVKAKDMSSLVIAVRWSTKKLLEGTEDIETETDKNFECLIQYNNKSGMFDLVKNLGDSPVSRFPKFAETFSKELTNSNCPYYIIGAWNKETDFSGEFPW